MIGHIYTYEFVGYRVSFKHSLFSVYGTHQVLYVFTYLPIYLFIYTEGQSERLKLYILESLEGSET